MSTLSGKTAVVTGASRGIGRAIAEKLAANGANVVLVATRQEVIAGVAAEVAAKYGVKAKGLACDVSNFDAVQDLLKTSIAEFGQIDILVNNAGITKDSLLMRMKEADWDSVIDINLKSVFNGAKAVARHMIKNKSGRIINMSSINGIVAQAGQANYAASKAGVIGITKSLAKELAAKKITVNAVAPGFIQTDMTDELSEAQKDAVKAQIPAGVLGEVDDIANAVLFLASPGAKYITGQVLSVDGGMNA
jgi:3-oxoacyl-[acyl-carrier protein] reductase